ncbi:MAG: hypothetical protein H0T17_00040 [Propionibacteriales bacterium]|nr:hypothetical protein [Propionibacteriales bacterium]
MNEFPNTSTTPPPRQQVWRTPPAHLASTENGFTQGALALSYPLPNGLLAEPAPRASSLMLVPTIGGAPTVCSVDTHTWALRFVQAVIEVISSDRPLTQLLRWTDEHVYAEIARRKRCAMLQRGLPAAGATRRLPPRQQIASLHVSQPSDCAAEVTARIMTPNRSRALAARLDYVRDRWTCTAIAFG